MLYLIQNNSKKLNEEISIKYKNENPETSENKTSFRIYLFLAKLQRLPVFRNGTKFSGITLEFVQCHFFYKNHPA